MVQYAERVFTQREDFLVHDDNWFELPFSVSKNNPLETELGAAAGLGVKQEPCAARAGSDTGVPQEHSKGSWLIGPDCASPP